MARARVSSQRSRPCSSSSRQNQQCRADAADTRTMSRQRRIGAALLAVVVLIVVPVSYALEGVGLAIVEGVLLALGGALGLWLAPEVKPPPPESVPRPAIGSSPEVVRRRRTEGFAVLVGGLPLAAAAVLVAIAADSETARLIGWVAAIVLLTFFGGGFLMVVASGRRWDRLRQRSYDRSVARAAADRAFYERHVDPSAERAKERRIVRLILVTLLWPLPVGLAIAPALLATQSGSALVTGAGMVSSLFLLVALPAVALRELRRRMEP